MIIKPYVKVVRQNSNNVFSPFVKMSYHFNNLKTQYSSTQIIKYFNLLNLDGKKVCLTFNF